MSKLSKLLKDNYPTIAFVFCCIICLNIVYNNGKIESEQKKYLKENYSFTIAKVTEYNGSGGLPRNIVFKYFVNGKKYKSSIPRDYQKNVLRKFYSVKYSNIKPEISEINLNRQITDSQKIAAAGFKIYTPGYH